MKPIAVLCVLAGMICSGCANGKWHGQQTYHPATGDSEAFDGYVRQRTAELSTSGKYTAAEVAMIAENEAARRFGARSSSSSYSTSWQWSNGDQRGLTLAELDKTMSDLKGK